VPGRAIATMRRVAEAVADGDGDVEIDTTRDGAVLSFLCPACSTAPTAELRATLVRVACEVVPGEVDRVDDVMPTAGHA
jgi:hypothetical protein